MLGKLRGIHGWTASTSLPGMPCRAWTVPRWRRSLTPNQLDPFVLPRNSHGSKCRKCSGNAGIRAKVRELGEWKLSREMFTDSTWNDAEFVRRKPSWSCVPTVSASVVSNVGRRTLTCSSGTWADCWAKSVQFGNSSPIFP